VVSPDDYYVHEDSCDHLRFNTADILPAAGAVAGGDLVIIGPAGGADHELNWIGIVDGTAIINADASAFVREGILVRTAKLSQVPGDAAFTAFGQEVWFDPVTGRVQSQEDDDVYLVGYLREVVDSDGVIGFEKRRYAILGTST
jgi:hypothetical protein